MWFCLTWDPSLYHTTFRDLNTFICISFFFNSRLVFAGGMLSTVAKWWYYWKYFYCVTSKLRHHLYLCSPKLCWCLSFVLFLSLQNLISKCSSNGTYNHLIAGDFNAPDINSSTLSAPSTYSDNLCSFISFYNLFQLIDSHPPTLKEIFWTWFLLILQTWLVMLLSMPQCFPSFGSLYYINVPDLSVFICLFCSW